MSSVPANADIVLQARDLVFAHPADPGGQAFELRVPELDVCPDEVLALCGPSGSGKSTLLAILAGLLRPHSGSVLFSGSDGPIDLYRCPRSEWRRLRRHFGVVSQDPRESLNDRRAVANIVADPLNIHGLPGDPAGPAGFAEHVADWLGRYLSLTGFRSHRERCARAVAALQRVGITNVQARRRPGALSGGQRQRVAIARALVGRPRLVFLDEPTSALDLSVQASVVELLQGLRQEGGRTAYLLVTHDLPLARQLADRIAILDGGRIVESGTVERIIREPTSPVTREMLVIARECTLDRHRRSP